MRALTRSEPIAIPTPSRPSTPSPLDLRPRSDTTYSTSSSSTILLTPQTPPILGVLSWSPVSPSEEYPISTGIRAKLSRSKSSFKDKTAKLRTTLTLNKSRTSLESAIFTEPEEYIPPPAQVDRFDALPRELRLLILRAVAMTSEGTGRWSGERGGKRELIKLSRVSRGWRDLCLDGQLWSILDLSSTAPFLHPRTLQRILASSQSYAKQFNLRGMDALTSLVPLPNLTHLDLRGCRQLDPYNICKAVAAPGLASVNLKGVQAVSPAVLRHLTSECLEMLDVSRCRSIDLADMAIFLRRPRVKLKDLRVAGLQARNAGRDFLRLAKVERLDLLGCDLQDEDMELSPTITHLILSSCPLITRTVFRRLDLPKLTSFELAGLDIFSENREPKEFHSFLRSSPELRKLDLDGTGLSGGVNDQVLDLLVRFCPELTELNINYARRVTPEAMVRLLRGCRNLTVFEADNTAADRSVMNEFMKRKEGRLNFQDCRAITPAAYTHVAMTTRPRDGWEGYEALPFGYDAGEAEGLIVKTFWSWRRVGVPRLWREARVPAEHGEPAIPAPGKSSRTRSIWREDDERDRCIVM